MNYSVHCWCIPLYLCAHCMDQMVWITFVSFFFQFWGHWGHKVHFVVFQDNYWLQHWFLHHDWNEDTNRRLNKLGFRWRWRRRKQCRGSDPATSTTSRKTWSSNPEIIAEQRKETCCFAEEICQFWGWMGWWVIDESITNSKQLGWHYVRNRNFTNVHI